MPDVPTPIDWPAIVSVGIAAGALALSVVNFVQAREPRVKWQLLPVEGNPRAVRLFNTSSRLSATITGLRDPDATDETDRVDYVGEPPFIVEPGSYFSFSAWQFLDDVPSRVTVEWIQKRWYGTRKFEATFYR